MHQHTEATHPVEADGPCSRMLVTAARQCGLYAIDFWRSDGVPQIVYEEGRQVAAEQLGRRLVLAMREVVRPADGHDDPAGAVIAAAVAFVELCANPVQPTPEAYRSAVSALVDAATPYTRGERPWDDNDKRMVLTNARRAWIRSWSGLRGGVR